MPLPLQPATTLHSPRHTPCFFHCHEAKARRNYLRGLQIHALSARKDPNFVATSHPEPHSRPARVAPHANKADDIHSTLAALRSKNRSPKKWLGQHYMLNQSINEKLVEVAQVENGDLVLEIGPGTGALTNILVERGAYVVAVEKDPDMAALVAERFQDCGQVEVVQEDFMKWPVRASVTHVMDLISRQTSYMKPAKVVSNLPFNITTSVVKRILPMGDIFSCMVLLLQDETASRLVDSSPGTFEYRPISLFVKFFSEPEYKLKVDRTNFFPQPHVDAAVVLFRIKQAKEYPPVSSSKAFFSAVNSAFSGKRKMLRKSLQHLYSSSEVQEALKSVDLLETARPDELSLPQFVAFYNALELQQERRACA